MERSTVGALLRSSQALCQQICEKQTLDFGIAFWSDRFSTLPEANQIREIIIADPGQVSGLFEEGMAFYARRGLQCLRFTCALDQRSDLLAPYVESQGFVRRELTVLHLAQWPDLGSFPEFRVLPARALREAFHATFLDSDVPADPAQRRIVADSFLERLDDPQLDMFVATIDKMPAGRCGLYQVGDIGRVIDLVILPQFQASEVYGALLAHVLGLAKRLAIPMVVVQVRSDDQTRLRLLRRAGFVPDGTIVEYERPTPFLGLSPL